MSTAAQWLAAALMFAGVACSAFGLMPQVVCMAMVVPGAIMTGINQWRRA